MGITIKNISFAYHPVRKVLNDVSCELADGQILGIMGPNGCGKTTLLMLLLGELKPASGQISWHESGRGPWEYSLTERAQQLAFVPAEEPLPLGMRVAEYVALGRTPHMGYWGHPSPHDFEQVGASLKRLQCADFLDRRLAELSSGERQRVRLARALAQESKIIILDEPASHLDLTYQHSVLNDLKLLSPEARPSIVVTLHQPWQARAFCDSVLLLNGEGRVAGFGKADVVLSAEQLQAVFHIDSYYGEKP